MKFISYKTKAVDILRLFALTLMLNLLIIVFCNKPVNNVINATTASAVSYCLNLVHYHVYNEENIIFNTIHTTRIANDDNGLFVATILIPAALLLRLKFSLRIILNVSYIRGFIFR